MAARRGPEADRDSAASDPNGRGRRRRRHPGRLGGRGPAEAPRRVQRPSASGGRDRRLRLQPSHERRRRGPLSVLEHRDGRVRRGTGRRARRRRLRGILEPERVAADPDSRRPLAVRRDAGGARHHRHRPRPSLPRGRRGDRRAAPRPLGRARRGPSVRGGGGARRSRRRDGGGVDRLALGVPSRVRARRGRRRAVDGPCDARPVRRGPSLAIRVGDRHARVRVGRGPPVRRGGPGRAAALEQPGCRRRRRPPGRSPGRPGRCRAAAVGRGAEAAAGAGRGAEGGPAGGAGAPWTRRSSGPPRIGGSSWSRSGWRRTAGRAQEAQDALDRARELNPRSPILESSPAVPPETDGGQVD